MSRLKPRPTTILEVSRGPGSPNLIPSRDHGRGHTGAGLSAHRLLLARAQLVGAPHARSARVRAPGTGAVVDGHLRSGHPLSARQSVGAAAAGAAGGFPVPHLPAERTGK